VQGFSEALRAELAKDGVDVLVVNPGRTQTNFGKNLIEQKSRRVFAGYNRGQSPERVAEATLRALERGKNEISLTLPGKVMLLMNRFLPRVTNWVFAREARKL
jgi:short-subunit dehydrogenase